MTPPYLTPWGLRSKPSTAPDYDPTSYAKGKCVGLTLQPRLLT